MVHLSSPTSNWVAFRKVARASRLCSTQPTEIRRLCPRRPKSILNVITPVIKFLVWHSATTAFCPSKTFGNLGPARHFLHHCTIIHIVRYTKGWSSCDKHRWRVKEDNDNDTQRSPSNNSQWPGLTSVSEGVMTPRRVCWSWWDLRCWQSVHLHTVDDSVQLHQTQNHERMSQTQAVAGINSLNSESLESSDSVQQNERDQESQKNSKRKSVPCAVAHQSDLSDFQLSWVGIGSTNFPIPSSSRSGCAHSYLLLRSILSTCSFFLSIHHEVLDHQSIRMFWRISFLEHLLVPATLRHVGCGVRRCWSFPNCFFSTFDIFFWPCVMWCWPLHHHSVSLRWRILLVGFENFFCVSHYFQIFLLQSLSNRFQVDPSSTVFCCFDPWFVVFCVTFSTICGLILFEFEKFVDVVFPSSSWSDNCTESLVSRTEFRFPFSSFHYPSLTWWRCDSQRQSPFHSFMSLDPTSNLRIFHLFHGFVCASFCVFNAFFFFFFFNRCCVNFIIGIVLERDVAVLIVVCVWALSVLIFIFSATQVFSVVVFVGLVFSFTDLFVCPFRLYD